MKAYFVEAINAIRFLYLSYQGAINRAVKLDQIYLTSKDCAAGQPASFLGTSPTEPLGIVWRERGGDSWALLVFRR
jgi:hypothetical protein